MNDRNLSIVEIEQLHHQGCTCTDWDRVRVATAFAPHAVWNTTFSGDIRLGVFARQMTLPGGIVKPSGILRATLHNCSVGDDTLIEEGYIANYTIGKECCIRHLDQLYVEGETTFGNGVEVSVLNETGGREVPIYNELSAQVAYMIAFYRHYPLLIRVVQGMVERYCNRVRSRQGRVGDRVVISHAGTLRNVAIGDCARLEGVSRLNNGSINSNAAAPVMVGCNVIADDFILSSGSQLTDGALIRRCFVGQGTLLSHLFSAHDSLFFCNCQGENGEACAIFAGPYTVTMHKSSLLIAGMFSFLNAGSGSNQSNHMYKLGPIHQGVVERGSKTTSDSYILWPAKIGAFSLVMGRHVRHSDTSELPFSYLIEKGNESFVVPGVNLRSVGTIRDAQKWPKRDLRTDPCKLDLVNFNLLSPYTIQKMMHAIELLKTLKKTSGEHSEVYAYQSANIRNGSLNSGISLYIKAINKFFGNSIIKRLEAIPLPDNAAIRQRLSPDELPGTGGWLDLAGLFAPKESVDTLIEDIQQQRITSLEQIRERFEWLHARYYDMEWRWVYHTLYEWYGINPATITAEEVRRIVTTWEEAVVSLDELLYIDAKKEFSALSRTGFGVDGDKYNRHDDFYEVRGSFETNSFVMAVKKHIVDKKALAAELLTRLPTP